VTIVIANKKYVGRIAALTSEGEGAVGIYIEEFINANKSTLLHYRDLNLILNS